MQFFIPAAKDSETAELVYEGAKKHAKDLVGWDISARRIFSIKHRHSGRFYDATVGKVYECTGAMVVAILESPGTSVYSGTFLVCTRHRGIREGMPILIGEHSIIEVTEFETN